MTGPGRALLAALVLAAGPALAGAVHDRSFESEALGAPMRYAVYLPDAAKAAGARLPVVLLLHGFGAGSAQWIRGAGLPETLDAMIDAGEIRPFIAVLPEAGNSWYVDSAAQGGAGDWETAIARDLVAEVDRRYPSDPRPAARGIAGLSMGGFGALRLAFRHPDHFAAVAAMSPAIQKPGGVSGVAGPLGQTPEARMHWYRGMIGPVFDRERFDALSPFNDLDRLAEAAAPPEVLITVGDDDYFALYDGSVEMFLDLRALGLKPELRVTDGGHDWEHWQPMSREVFRFMGGALPAE